MRALVLADGHPSLRDDHPEPRRAPGEARVAVRLAGICDTDLQLARGYLAFRGVPGHEFVGIVEEADDDTWIGARVVGEINAGCGTCERCRRGDPRHCAARTVLGIDGRDGAFAERLVLPEANLHRVPASISDEAAVFAEPLAAACRVVAQRPVAAGERAVVLGDGKLGLLIAAVLGHAGAEVRLAGHHPAKLALARAWGVEGVLEDDLPADRGADLVVDATGSARGLEAALRLVRPEGTVVLKTTIAGEHRGSLAPVVIDEITVVGSRCGPFPPALALLADGVPDVAPLVEAIHPLADGVAAMDAAARPGARKVLLRP